MNTNGNLRYQETEKKIMDVFIDLLNEMPLEKITVSAICRGAGINRSSFYLHYTDVYTLMDEIEHRLSLYLGQLFSETKDEYDIGQRFLRLLYFISDHRDFYRVYFERKDTIHALDYVLPENAAHSLSLAIEELGFTENEYFYHQTFFRAGFAAMLKEWVLRDCVESPEEIMGVIEQEYHPNIEMFMHPH